MSGGALFIFIHTPNYSVRAKKLFSDKDQRKVEELICDDPTAGELQAGVRKIRVPIDGRGKSSGVRVIYYFVERRGQVYLLDVFPKNVKASLSKAEQNQMRRLVQILEED